MRVARIRAVAAIWVAVGSGGAGGADELVLWYARPASRWNEALPVGNGRLGAMVFGGIDEERLQLNEDSLWSGSPEDPNNPEAREALARIREFLFAGRHEEADRLAARTLVCRGRGSGHGRGGKIPFGCYQSLGDLRIRFGGGSAPPSGYRRELDLDAAVARVSYARDGARYAREVFSSAPDQVLVIRLACDRPGRISFAATLGRIERAATAPEGEAGLVMRGRMDDGAGGDGMAFVARLLAIPEGGEVRATEDGIRVECADAATLLLAAATDYRMAPPDYKRAGFEEECAARIAAAARKPYAALREDAVADHRRLFRRVRLDLGGAEAAARPTDERLAAVRAGAADPHLEVLHFQFGRYLLIGSSRPGDLPANLQGIWADGTQTPWNCDYHTDINVQMNYWPAETTNLSECALPLFDLIESLREPGRRTARIHYGARGWTVHTVTNVWGFTAPGEHPGWGLFPLAGAWLCRHIWERYEFTGDRDFLARHFPAMKEAAEFVLDWLVEDPKTKELVSGPANSPENRFRTADGQVASLSMGPSMDQEIIWDLLTNTIEAARALGTDVSLVVRLAGARARLLGPRIGSDGRLLEWAEEFGEPEPGHRHISHLYGLCPGRQITPAKTPELAAAARKSLEHRLAHGGGHTGWSRAWVINFWARLGDGDRAHENLVALLAKSTLPNLLDTHPPFQIDGNFGACAGVAEMLLQSHAGEVHLLPALPKAWPKGRVEGLCARGGFEVDIAWEGGALTAATIRSKLGHPCRVRNGARTVDLSTVRGGSYLLGPDLQKR